MKKWFIRILILAGIIFVVIWGVWPGIPKVATDSSYPVLSLDTLTLNLGKRVHETSALIRYGHKLITINDSGNRPVLYVLNASDGRIEGEVIVSNASNVDWECMTRDESFIYVGDTGNNLGRRKNLRVYKIAIAAFEEALEGDQKVTAKRIDFYYPEQKAFPGSYTHNFDAESIFSFGDHLFLFTKNWGNRRSALYQIPKSPGNWPARILGDFGANGLITDACQDDRSGRIFLLGCNYGPEVRSFLWILSNFEPGNPLTGDFFRYDLGVNRQTEAICMGSTGELMISAEQGKNKHASLFSLSIADLEH